MIRLLASLCLAQTQASAEGDTVQWLEALGAGDRDPMWLIFGMVAQLFIVVGVVVHLVLSRRRGKVVIPSVCGYAGVVATLMLLVYATQQRDLVFMVGQFINTLICVRLLALSRREEDRLRIERTPRFPVVAPDMAERETPRDED